MQTCTPAEVDAEQARQILGQIRTRAAQADDCDESVVRVGPLRPTCHGVERIDGVEAGACRYRLHRGVQNGEAGGSESPRRASNRWRIAATSSAMSSTKLTRREARW